MKLAFVAYLGRLTEEHRLGNEVVVKRIIISVLLAVIEEIRSRPSLFLAVLAQLGDGETNLLQRAINRWCIDQDSVFSLFSSLNDRVDVDFVFHRSVSLPRFGLR